LNQQQLQTARTALWHQTAPLMTGDEAKAWVEDLGLCLYLPRHAQLPAPAPSFLEAIHGAPSAAPPASALKLAGELVARLVDERSVVPLNLLGTYSEQPDFLVTPEVLPWVTAVRGDRQWNAAPGGRTSPLVVRTWQILDREGEASAIELRALLGRELTEAAVLRALIELWTTMRAIPVTKPNAAPGDPARWTLLKNRFPAQLTTGANTAQTIALSALLSIYLRSAVAATAEEAEIFLSPLTARSRIREVIHGMSAARQFASMSVGSQTLLFVAGSLPENLTVEEPQGAVASERPMSNRVSPPPDRAPRPADRTSRPAGRPSQSGTRPSRPAERPARPPFRREFQDERRPAGPRDDAPRPGRREFGDRTRPGGGAKPWQRPKDFRGPAKPAHAERPAAESRSEARGEKRPLGKSRPPLRGDKRPGARPWQRREGAAPGQQGEDRKRFDRDRDEKRPRFGGEKRSGQKFGRPFGKKSGEKAGPRSSGPKDTRGRKPAAKSFGGPRSEFPPRREGGSQPPGDRERSRGGPPPRFGKPLRKEPGGAFGKRKFPASGRKNFRKGSPGERNPRKNRSQEENPE
jgi:hypothetical protein